MQSDIELGVSEFVALFNQTIEYAYPSVVVVGELANFRVSKNRWVYFDLKDAESVVRCFGTVYALPGPLEDGMMIKVKSQPRLHQQYGFSLNLISIQPAGEGSIKKAANLLEAKLAAEGLFDAERKRSLPYPPQRIGLVTSVESAAYSDFIKILNERWQGIGISVSDVLVQGDTAPEQIVKAIEYLNQLAVPPEVMVLIRGGGSAEDLQAFSNEQVTRAVAASRVPTLVAIGHERDICLAELAADQRASTPSNAAELLTPSREEVRGQLKLCREQLDSTVSHRLKNARQELAGVRQILASELDHVFETSRRLFDSRRQLLEILNPQAALSRGYAIVRKNGKVIRSVKKLAKNDILELEFQDGEAEASVN